MWPVVSVTGVCTRRNCHASVWKRHCAVPFASRTKMFWCCRSTPSEVPVVTSVPGPHFVEGRGTTAVTVHGASHPLLTMRSIDDRPTWSSDVPAPPVGPVDAWIGTRSLGTAGFDEPEHP